MDDYVGDPQTLSEQTVNVPALRTGTVRTALNGEPFDVTKDTWSLSIKGGVRYFKFDWCDKYLSPELKDAAKEVFAIRLETKSASTEYSRYSAFKRLCKKGYKFSEGPLSEINGDLLEMYFLKDSNSGSCYLKGLFQTWLSRQFPGVTDCVWNAVKDRILGSTRDTSNITTLCPKTGPYLDSEIDAVDRELNLRYEENTLTDAQFILAMIIRLYGQRPSMVADMKCFDVRTPKHNNVPRASLRFPLVKKRNPEQYSGPARPLPMFFLAVLDRWLDKLYAGVPEKDRDDLPLFPANSLEYARSYGYAGLGRGQTAKGYEGHCTAGTITSRYKSIMKSLEVISPRTNELMHYSPTRERHTIGTLLATRGLAAPAIAAWMHHNSLQSCEAYIEVASRHHQLMHSMLDGKFAHLAGCFMGEVIEDEDLDDMEDAALLQNFYEEDAPIIGGCGSGGCLALNDLSAPFACFLCTTSFRLSEHADLRPLMVELVARKKKAKAEGDSELSMELNKYLSAIAAAQRELDNKRAAKEKGENI